MKKIIYISFGILFALILFINALGLFTQNQTPPPNPLRPTPTLPRINQQSSSALDSHPDENEKYKKSFEKISQQEQAQYEQWQKIASMRISLPYYGKLFSLSYDYSIGSFILKIDSRGTEEGSREFQAFLQKKGISDASSLNNIITEYIQPTPAP